jgi:drug/metabolite transporter (DMT)-like permease
MLFRNVKGLPSIALSSFFFGFSAIFIKLAAASVSAAEILMFRALIGLAFIILSGHSPKFYAPDLIFL